MSELHPIEEAWRRFRGSENYKLLKRSFEMQPGYLDFIGLKHLPPGLALAGAVPLNLLLNMRPATRRRTVKGSSPKRS
jgi:hypothetical protein